MRSSNRLQTFARATVTRVFAVWFVVLTTLPFTAPFATVDLPEVWGHAQGPKATTTVSAPAVGSPQPDDNADDVATSDASGQRVLPTTRGARVSGTSPVSSRTLPATAELVTPAGSAPPTRVSAVLVALRL